jgi:predicted transcriptional regulator
MDILAALRTSNRPLDDDQLAEILGVDRREVVRHCRRLAFQGIIIREQGRNGNIVNVLDKGMSTGDGRLYFEDQVHIEG